VKIGDNIERDREWCNEWCRDLHILTDVHERWLGPLPSSVTLSKMVTISDPRFPCLQMGTIILYIIPPPGKAIPHGLIPASAGSCGQGSHHSCFTMVFSLASCPPHHELLEDLYRGSVHVYHLMSHDKVRYTAVQLLLCCQFVANNT